MQHFVPNDSDLRKLAYFQSLAPLDGGPFHDSAHLEIFQAIPSSEHMPNGDTIQRIGELQAVASLMGAFAVGKNGAKTEAIAIASHTEYQAIFPGGVHEVLMGTTRLPLFRDGRVEDFTNYMFCFAETENRRLVEWYQNGELVQWAQPRGNHVYFSWIGSYPTSGVALLDTIPATLNDLDRVLAPAGKEAIGIYRTVESYEEWMYRMSLRGDLITRDGMIIDEDNFQERMQEAINSLVEAMDLRSRLKFFEAEQRREAGKLVLEIIRAVSSGEDYPEEAQKSAIDGAYLMIKGLKDRGFKAA